MRGIALDDGANVLGGQVAGVEVDVEAAAAVHASAGIVQGGGHGHGLLDAGLVMQDGRHHLEAIAHAGVADQLPVGAGGMVVALGLHIDAHGAQGAESGFVGNADDFQFDAELAIHD